MSQRMILNADDFKKLVRGEIVSQGDLQVSLQEVGYEQMYNAIANAITSAPILRDHWLKLDEGERQMLILALAELSLQRPGFDDALRRIAERVDNKEDSMFEALKRCNADKVFAPQIEFLFLKEDTEDIRRWIHGINQHEPTKPGDFLLIFAAAVCRADAGNYPLLRTSILQLMEKFPKYRFEGAI
ncbi:MAG TPA: hypothetical protein VGK36_08930 [Candidatus Angelobacter sp.]|jgi:hypothetical protein